LGVVASFFYVGVEVGIPGTLNFYLADQGPNGAGVTGDASTIAGAIVAFYWLLMLVGRFLSGFISGAVSSKIQLTVVASSGVLLCLAAILTPQSVRVAVPSFLYDAGAEVPLSAMFLVLCGLSTSIMWGSIFNLAVEGLGKYTAQASGIFMMMVVGGGIMPLIQSALANSLGYIASYWLVVAMFAYILFYGLIGSKNVNTDIPVAEEETVDPRNL
ncbi:MAG: MFS transporter, partial [Duncaniella sp.]|nr:MFS transporter [Duncaniella sp.]